MGEKYVIIVHPHSLFEIHAIGPLTIGELQVVLDEYKSTDVTITLLYSFEEEQRQWITK
jgi:hypothetical protein